MSGPWTLTAAANEVDASNRATFATEMLRWIDAGGVGVALITCHRAELYGFDPPPALEAPRFLTGDGATAHLMRVACGLESVIVGEDEVLRQVREALRRAADRPGLDHRLRRLFETAIAAGRRARSGRTESSGNLAQNAVAWLRDKSDVSGRTVMVVGAGRMGAALAHSARRAGAQITIASRDGRRASRLAHEYAGNGVDLRAGAELAGQAAGVAVALGGPWTELEPTAAHGLPPIVDISAPSAVSDAVRVRMNGSFLGIDDLYRRGGTLPGAYIKDAERLVGQKTAEYAAWLRRVS
jgi:glutamyl-tRNA reductase